MSRVVFINVSAAGHVIPTFGLVKELLHQGEEVIYYEISKFQSEIEAFGAAFRAYPEIPDDTFPSLDDNDFTVVPVLTWTARQMLPWLLESLRIDKPDYIIHDSLCLWGKIAAQLLNIPAVNSIATAAFNHRSLYECSIIAPQLPVWLSEESLNVKSFFHYERELRETYNIPHFDFIDVFTNVEPLNICYLPRELQPYVEKFDHTFHFVGPCDPVRTMEFDFPMEQLWAEKLILISFGNIHDPGYEFYQNCIEAFKELDVQVLMVISSFTEIEQLGNIPSNFIVRRTGTVPQLKILERTSLFIMHGAGGGTREAVWYSVPMIAVPQTYEQYIISLQIEAQGAGICLKPEVVNAELLQKTSLKILNDSSFQANSARLGDACRTAGGTDRAVREIFQYLGKSDPVLG
ncbi:MGT family glycosyltransferase [Aetokthonos hydrillicola Thurmond2011]|jgi:MGT family glycosyltransferase|uniref:MGT family glycosyltransferase n=1 Tax=Aetokthonos hydrillicola Thurmond2011 TaxID=2712845 RepID=A0AAP5I8U7_9CYAN|nr:macrolide family glycosyltransferase [Aetokthonos hydrillicola]MBO3458684.1 MGT family glycosyltransferase [Aetokthonos hydrillicola CCALA 1050]MBW4588037.1 MGT family glycosyltransferase [Aetokthonos hydrillicola CCALA 1050]MDR9897011.1 MGT family glycosyltransferase [Aetokthonos hydrillicola Thurmond2011]